MVEKTPGGDCCIVEVRTKRGMDDLRGELVVGRGMGVMGAPGLCSLFTVVNEGLKAGVWGEGATNETWDAVEVE
jgi:hypothetical protein